MACGSVGQWEKAVGFIAEMEGLGVGQHEICYLAAIKACEKAGQADQAACLAETLRGLPPTARGRGRNIMDAFCDRVLQCRPLYSAG